MTYMESFSTVTHSLICKEAQQGDRQGYTHAFSPHILLIQSLICSFLGNNQRPRVGGPDSFLYWRKQTTAVAYH